MVQKLLRRIVVERLVGRVRALRARHEFVVVAVAGGIGKTSTKLAIAQLLDAHKRVQYQEGNYNDLVTVPLVFFGLSQPSLRNPLAWLRTFRRMDQILAGPYPYDVVVIELGTDAPGKMAEFQKYFHADIGVLTAIVPEHMEFFGTMQAVADEELVLARMCDTLLVNRDLCDERYLHNVPVRVLSYGERPGADYRLADVRVTDGGHAFSVLKQGKPFAQTTYNDLSRPRLYGVTAALAVADMLHVAPDEAAAAVSQIQPVSGRLRQLNGANGSLIIDDTYNASPDAVKSALDVLYSIPAQHRIAILGSMNELGDHAATAHQDVGAYCDPEKLELVVTIGQAANDELGAAAEQRGCTVKRCVTPYEAGLYVREHLAGGTVVLAKGSQNRVFAEESVRLLLADPKDEQYLVRQGSYWIGVKQKQFGERPRIS